MKIVFSPQAHEDLSHFREHAPKMAEKIKRLLEDVGRTPYEGLGKPEPLKYGLSGFWSRRINREHRLVYKVEAGVIYVVSCRYHY